MESEAISVKPLDELIRGALASGAVFTSRQAADAGVSPAMLTRAVKAGRIDRISRGIYIVGGVTRDWWTEARVAVVWSAGALSHRSAAFVHGLGGCPETIEVAVATGRRPPPDREIVCHVSEFLTPPHVVAVNGLLVTSPARVLLDLGLELPREELEAMLEECLRRGLVTLARLKWQLGVEGARGRGGTAALRELLTDRDPAQKPTESVLETRLARWFRTTGLPDPVRQHRVIDKGRFVARLDFAYPGEKVAIEAQSFRWHSGRREWARDQKKKRALEALGWKVLEVVEEDFIRDSAILEARIAGLLSVSLF